MKFQRLTEFDTDTLIHEMEVRGYWSIPKWNVQTVNAAQNMDVEAVAADPKTHRTYCADAVAVRLGRFLLDTDKIRFREWQGGFDGMTRELIGTVHVVTEMPRELLRASLSVPVDE